MKVLVSEMPKKKEECLFLRRKYYYDRVMEEFCSITGTPCKYKNGDSICGGECRYLRVGCK